MTHSGGGGGGSDGGGMLLTDAAGPRQCGARLGPREAGSTRGFVICVKSGRRHDTEEARPEGRQAASRQFTARTDPSRRYVHIRGREPQAGRTPNTPHPNYSHSNSLESRPALCTRSALSGEGPITWCSETERGGQRTLKITNLPLCPQRTVWDHPLRRGPALTAHEARCCCRKRGRGPVRRPRAEASREEAPFSPGVG